MNGTVGDALALLRLQNVDVNSPIESDANPLSARWNAVPLSTVLHDIAQAISRESEIIERSGSWWVGPPSDTDLETRRYYLPYESASAAENVIKITAGDRAKTAFVNDVLVVRDTPLNLSRFEKGLEQLISPRAQWEVGVQLMELNENAARMVGLDWSLTGTGSLTSILEPSSLVKLGQLAANVNLQASSSDGWARNVSTTTLLVMDGETSKIHSGEKTPVPRRTVSPEGTVTTTGFEQVESGIIITISPRTSSEGTVILRVTPEISTITGFIDGSPKLSIRSLNSVAHLRPPQTIALGGLDRAELSSDHNKAVPFLERFTGSTQRIGSLSRLYLFVTIRPAQGFAGP